MKDPTFIHYQIQLQITPALHTLQVPFALAGHSCTAVLDAKF